VKEAEDEAQQTTHVKLDTVQKNKQKRRQWEQLAK
jgi:hypothetical protein